MAAPTCYITTIKRFTYRGDANEEWSNSYALTGPTPTDSTAWRALFDALVAQEKTVIGGNTTIVAGYGYNRVPVSGDHAIWSVDLTVSPNTPVAGTLAVTNKMAGDQATWIRWKLDRLSAKGKPVYLRKYFHDGNVATGGGDQVGSAQTTAMTAFGTKLRDGTFLDGRVITDHLGTAVVGAGVSSYITTRTLKRRGKRPPT